MKPYLPVHIIREASNHVLPEIVVDADGGGFALHETHVGVALELACREREETRMST